jgi:hypothetical protein
MIAGRRRTTICLMGNGRIKPAKLIFVYRHGGIAAVIDDDYFVVLPG